ncbi:MAG: response regulator transcription factor [Chlorobi bacterium]|nr:response regulator transcription factor [Chlorobiota bacterium]
MNKLSVCIADDHKIVSEGIASFFIGNDRFELVYSSSSGKELLNNLKNKQTDIVILDIKMPGLSGIQIAKIIKNDYPHIKTVFLSSIVDKKTLDEAIKAGGVGYLSKDIDEEEFLFALKAISEGKNYYSKGVQQTVFNNYTNNIKADNVNENDLLSKRETEVIKLIADGLSFKEIANKLFISTRTVETHKKNILEKLELKSTIDLVKYAILNGLSDL